MIVQENKLLEIDCPRDSQWHIDTLCPLFEGGRTLIKDTLDEMRHKNAALHPYQLRHILIQIWSICHAGKSSPEIVHKKEKIERGFKKFVILGKVKLVTVTWWRDRMPNPIKCFTEVPCVLSPNFFFGSFFLFFGLFFVCLFFLGGWLFFVCRYVSLRNWYVVPYIRTWKHTMDQTYT